MLGRKYLRRIFLILVTNLTVFIVAGVGILISDDPASIWLRRQTEHALNSYIESLYGRARDGRLSKVDLLLLRIETLIGIGLGRIMYPEAGAILQHYLYGNGAELMLSADYLQESSYLKEEIQKRSDGIYGPIAFEPSKDRRLSLALNPYYLEIKPSSIRIFHPKIQFAGVSSVPTITIVPLGKMSLRIYDNLVSAMNPTPFPVYAEWSRPP